MRVCYDSQRFDRIEELFEQMQQMHIVPCVYSFSYAIIASSRLSKQDEVLKIYAQMQAAINQLPTASACNVVMSAFVRVGTRNGCVD
jgi:hypothetical protein